MAIANEINIVEVREDMNGEKRENNCFIIHLWRSVNHSKHFQSAAAIYSLPLAYLRISDDILLEFKELRNPVQVNLSLSRL